MEQLVQIMDELYDEEFEDVIDDLNESRVETDNYFNNAYQARQMLHEYYL